MKPPDFLKKFLRKKVFKKIEYTIMIFKTFAVYMIIGFGFHSWSCVNPLSDSRILPR